MDRWTIQEPFSGQYRLMINHGGSPFWCMMDFAVWPEHISEEVTISTIDADDVTLKWFPYLRLGMLRGLAKARDSGAEWSGIRIEIQKIYAHPIDTTAQGCENYGFSFILDRLFEL